MKFVAGDTLQKIRVEFVDAETKDPIDLTDLTAKIRFKVPGETTVTVKTMSTILPATDGIATHTFLGAELVEGEMRGEFQLVNSSLATITCLAGWKAEVRALLA